MSFSCKLPIVQAQEPSERWYQAVQLAIINTRGVFAIANFSEDLTWKTGSKLSRKVLKAYMCATMHNPWELHPGLDLHNGEAESESRLQAISASAMESHVDRGLFNIVQATGADRRDLHIDTGGGNFVDALSLTGSPTAKLLVVIPGYSLQAFEPKVVAPAHEVKKHGSSRRRSTKVFQCRLAKAFEIQGQRIEVVLANTFHNKPAERKFTLIVKTSSGTTHVVEATSEMCVRELKIGLQDKEGMDPDEQLLVSAGRQLEDEMRLGTNMDGSTIHLMRSIKGD